MTQVREYLPNASDYNSRALVLAGAALLWDLVLILGAGLYEFFANSVQTVVLADLHAGIRWELLMLILGGIYAYRFFPRKEGS